MSTKLLLVSRRPAGERGIHSSYQAMRFNTLLGLSFFLLLLATGCTERAPTATIDGSSSAIEAHRLAKNSTPFRMTGEGAFLGQDFAPGFGPPLFGKSTFDGRCSQPSDFVIRFGVWGEATHLGRADAHLEHCSIVDFQTGRSAIIDGEMVIIASNGDELHVQYSRAADQVVEPVEFVGGTGRFSNASGEGHQTATVDRATGTVTSFNLEGLISYQASDRRNQDSNMASPF